MFQYLVKRRISSMCCYCYYCCYLILATVVVYSEGVSLATVSLATVSLATVGSMNILTVPTDRHIFILLLLTNCTYFKWLWIIAERPYNVNVH